MVASSDSWEEQTRKYLTEIQLELNEVKKELEELEHKRDTLDCEAEAYRLALESYFRRTGRQDILGQEMRDLLARQRNHEERLKRIAEQNDGLLRIAPAADLLFNYQLIGSKSRMAAYRVVYGLVVGMVQKGLFQKVGAAEFRLVGTQVSLSAVSANASKHGVK